MSHVAVVIPCYKVTAHILQVIAKIGAEVSTIYVVDDCCPEQSGEFVRERCTDPRVKVLKNEQNLGVGGAVLHGYRAAIDDGADIIVKVDGDDQMDCSLLPYFIAPIEKGLADYTKGNRFYDLSFIGCMPKMRIFGNAVLSFLSKISTGYWGLFDPTNGYTAIHARVAERLPFDKISRRYFFETDILFRLNTVRAVVLDIPMHARYGDETSHLRITKVIPEFLRKHVRNFGKRIVYNYFLRDMTIASLELVCGAGLLMFGLLFGAVHWVEGMFTKQPTAVGALFVSTICLLVGLQLLLAFFAYDIANTPRRPIHDDLPTALHNGCADRPADASRKS